MAIVCAGNLRFQMTTAPSSTTTGKAPARLLAAISAAADWEGQVAYERTGKRRSGRIPTLQLHLGVDFAYRFGTPDTMRPIF